MKRILLTLLMSSLFAAQASSAAPKFEVVQMQNATNCHIKQDGTHYLGQGINSIGTFSEWGNQYGTIDEPGSSGPVPVINGNTVILDLNMNADEFNEDYKPGDKYIISDDNSSLNCYSTSPGVLGCFKLAATNPCE